MKQYILGVLFSIFMLSVVAAPIKVSMDSLDKINLAINAVPYKSDIDHWKQNDYWATPNEFYTTNGGDCEDYAIAKYFALIDYGIEPHNLLITAGRLDNGGYHMVLFILLDQIYVLDNMHNHIIPLHEYTEFTAFYHFNETVVVIGEHAYGISMLKKWNNLISKMNKQNN